MPTRTLQSEEELLLLRALFRASDYGVLLSDTSRQDLVCNDRFCELFSLERKTVLESAPQSIRTTVASRLKDPDGFVRTLDAIYSDPNLVCEDELEVTTPRRRILRRYTAPVLSDDKKIIGRIWTFLDITRTRRLENKVQNQTAELRQQAKMLAGALKSAHGRLNQIETELSETQLQLVEYEKLSAVGLVSASVAHDIRNILTPLTIEMTLADQDDAAARRESFDLMKKQIDRLSLLTQSLLSLSRPTATDHADISIAEAIARTVETVASQASIENVSIIKKISRGLPTVCGDEVQIDQALLNIALNAVQAMHEHGGTLTLSASRSRGGVSIKIGDTGHGIPSGFKDRLFDPFFTTRTEGAGLGLFSAKRIVELHGGTIRTGRGTGIGTEFTIWLPTSAENNQSQSDGGA